MGALFDLVPRIFASRVAEEVVDVEAQADAAAAGETDELPSSSHMLSAAEYEGIKWGKKD